MSLPLSLSAALGLACTALPAVGFQGAESILNQAAAASEKPAGAAGENDPAAGLAEKLRVFGAARHSLPPAEAADQWLASFDAYRRVSPEDLKADAVRRGVKPVSMGALMVSLPPSAAWDRIRAGLEMRAAAEQEPLKSTLRLFATILGGENEARLNVIDALQAVAPGDDYSWSRGIESMRQAVESAETDPEKVVAAFERRLAEAEAPPRRNRISSESTLEIPDLVKLAGREKAVLLLNRAVVLNRELVVKGDDTRALLIEAIIRNAGHLKKPQWKLVTGYDAIPLYETLVRKFPAGGSDYRRDEADIVFLLSLIGDDRTVEAKGFFKDHLSGKDDLSWSVGSDAFEAMSRNGLIGKMYAFAKELLVQDPGLPFWKDLQEFGMANGQSADFVKTLREAMAKPGLNPAQRGELKDVYRKHLLAIGSIDEGVVLLREKLSNDPAGDGDLGIQLMRIGHLLQKPEWIEEGLASVRKHLQQPDRRASYTNSFPSELTDELVALGRGEEAESLLAERLVALRKSMRDDTSSEAEEAMEQLVRLYDKTGRPADVLFLLDHAPDWSVSDVRDLSESQQLVAARALATAGRNAEAAAIARQVIQSEPGSDPAYELLLKLGGDDLVEYLDKVHASDRFEERPLIWKAKLLLDQDKIDDAEKIVRQAIAVDPSDGEQGKGDRLRAYAILADVVEKKGDAAQAATLRTAVKAIRLSEDADDWYAAGLWSRAAAMYEESLGLFADAYCIQSRLARRQTELGEFEKAAEHYRRAFELMPDSFGRVESHCFGCEGTFSDPKAQTTAEKVFSKLVEALPDRPQVFYLYGYLKEEQGKPEEAAALFQKAVKLDPDYLNAWSHLAATADRAGLPPTECDEILLRILQLDPSGRSADSSFKSFHDLRKFWDALLAADRSMPPFENRPLYPLAASKLAIEDKRENSGGDMDPFGSRNWRYDPDPHARLVEEFSSHTLVESTTELLEEAIHGN